MSYFDEAAVVDVQGRIVSAGGNALAGESLADYVDDADRYKLAAALARVFATEGPSGPLDVTLRDGRRARVELKPCGSYVLSLWAGAPETTSLSRHERKVLHAIADGLNNAAIAETLATTEATVRSTISRLRRKLGATRPEHALSLAVQAGLVPTISRRTVLRRQGLAQF